jgi:8-oxo-dGTP pyrophosphatase MutT (NUDIX family)
VPAATLILTREKAGSLQVYLLRRSPTSSFMPGSFVFPGGLVDQGDRDTDFWRTRIDLAPEAFDHRLGEENAFDALAYAVAAIRETFEESRALLARRRQPGAADYEEACALRMSNGSQHGWFNRLAGDREWVLSLSRLWPWARWITPTAMPRRFDTRFFVSPLPQGQQCRADSYETTEGIWIEPREALQANLDGSVPLTPPGLVTLQELLRYPSWPSLLAAAANRRWSTGIMPRLLPFPASRQGLILMPWDPQYDREAAEILSGAATPDVLHAGEPFSRVWNDGSGRWRPIRVGLIQP